MQPPLDQLERLGGALLLLGPAGRRRAAAAPGTRRPVHPGADGRRRPAAAGRPGRGEAGGARSPADPGDRRPGLDGGSADEPDQERHRTQPAGRRRTLHLRRRGAVRRALHPGRGAGFAPADLPRLFDRFYRGAGAAPAAPASAWPSPGNCCSARAPCCGPKITRRGAGCSGAVLPGVPPALILSPGCHLRLLYCCPKGPAGGA